MNTLTTKILCSLKGLIAAGYQSLTEEISVPELELRTLLITFSIKLFKDPPVSQFAWDEI